RPVVRVGRVQRATAVDRKRDFALVALRQGEDGPEGAVHVERRIGAAQKAPVAADRDVKVLAVELHGDLGEPLLEGLPGQAGGLERFLAARQLLELLLERGSV